MVLDAKAEARNVPNPAMPTPLANAWTGPESAVADLVRSAVVREALVMTSRRTGSANPWAIGPPKLGSLDSADAAPPICTRTLLENMVPLSGPTWGSG